MIGASYTYVPATISIILAGQYSDVLNPQEVCSLESQRIWLLLHYCFYIMIPVYLSCDVYSEICKDNAWNPGCSYCSIDSPGHNCNLLDFAVAVVLPWLVCTSCCYILKSIVVATSTCFRLVLFLQNMLCVVQVSALIYFLLVSYVFSGFWTHSLILHLFLGRRKCHVSKYELLVVINITCF